MGIFCHFSADSLSAIMQNFASPRAFRTETRGFAIPIAALDEHTPEDAVYGLGHF
jgi:hypothetical protein